MKTLRDRVAVVTGAAAGVGRAIALEMAQAGAHVVLADTNEAGMASVAREVDALGRRCSVVPTDVRHLAQVERLLAVTLAQQGSCHLMINNAGVLRAAPLMGVAFSEWQRIVDVNLWGVLHGCRVFGEHFARQRLGHIVNMASAAGIFPSPGMTMYSATKFAVVGFTRQLRWELAPEGVGVTLAVPGLMKTGIFSGPEAGLAHLNLDFVMRASRAPAGFARKVRRAVEKDRAVVTHGLEPRLFALMRMLPTWIMDPIARHFARGVLRLLRGQHPAAPQRQLADRSSTGT